MRNFPAPPRPGSTPPRAADGHRPAFLVVGSAHLDILSTVTGDALATDKVGEVRIEIGGTAANIALNLVRLGAQANLLTAMNESPFSRIIKEYMSASGVDLVVETRPALPAAAFSAYVEPSGEMISAVSSMPVDQVEFDPFRVRALAETAIGIILDCNLSASTLNNIVEQANAMAIPVYVAAVSEEKSLRLREISGRIDAVFLNRKECAYLSAKRPAGAPSRSEINIAIDTTVAVTVDEDGVFLARDGGFTYILPPALSASEQWNRLGAGDAFLAATIFHHLAVGLSLESAARAAVQLAGKVTMKPDCNVGQMDPVPTFLADIELNATLDRMTGLPNRATAEQAIASALDRAAHDGQDVALLLLDLDHFKRINDTYGHKEGDGVLAIVGRVIRESLRTADIAGRWSGEEFIVMLPDADRSMASSVAERIRCAVQVELADLKATASCGVAFLGPDGRKLQALVQTADARLHVAKHRGRNRVVMESMLPEASNDGVIAL